MNTQEEASDEWEEVGNLGDVNWVEHGGGPILVSRETGEARLEYVEAPPDEQEFDDPDARWTIYRVDLEPGMPTWGDAADVARTVDTTVRELKRLFVSEDPLERALAYDMWASHYGWHEFDQDPLVLTCEETEERYDVDICDEDEDEDEGDEDDDEDEDEDDFEPASLETIREGFKAYFEHEGHDVEQSSRDMMRAIVHSGDDPDRALKKANELLDGHGIEAIRGESFNDNYYGDIVALYVNMGDTYDTTLLYETENDRFVVTTMGDWVEANQDTYDIQ